MVFQEATSEPVGKAKKLPAWPLMPHNQQPGKQVAIVSSIITRTFNSCKHWMVMTQPSVYMLIESVLSLFVASLFFCSIFLLVFCFCSIHHVRLFSVQLFFQSVYFSVLILELYSRYFDPLSTNNQKAPSFVVVQEGRAYYQHRHQWISGTNFSIQVKRRARQPGLPKLHCISWKCWRCVDSKFICILNSWRLAISK